MANHILNSKIEEIIKVQTAGIIGRPQSCIGASERYRSWAKTNFRHSYHSTPGLVEIATSAARQSASKVTIRTSTFTESLIHFRIPLTVAYSKRHKNGKHGAWKVPSVCWIYGQFQSWRRPLHKMGARRMSSVTPLMIGHVSLPYWCLERTIRVLDGCEASHLTEYVPR